MPDVPPALWSVENGYAGGPWAYILSGYWGSVGYDLGFEEGDPAEGVVWGRYAYWGGTCVHNCTNLYEQPHSFHPGGVLYAFADGSVRPVRDGVSRHTFRRLVWKADGEVITEDY